MKYWEVKPAGEDLLRAVSRGYMAYKAMLPKERVFITDQNGRAVEYVDGPLGLKPKVPEGLVNKRWSLLSKL